VDDAKGGSNVLILANTHGDKARVLVGVTMFYIRGNGALVGFTRRVRSNIDGRMVRMPFGDRNTIHLTIAIEDLESQPVFRAHSRHRPKLPAALIMECAVDAILQRKQSDLTFIWWPFATRLEATLA